MPPPISSRSHLSSPPPTRRVVGNTNPPSRPSSSYSTFAASIPFSAKRSCLLFSTLFSFPFPFLFPPIFPKSTTSPPSPPSHSESLIPLLIRSTNSAIFRLFSVSVSTSHSSPSPPLSPSPSPPLFSYDGRTNTGGSCSMSNCAFGTYFVRIRIHFCVTSENRHTSFDGSVPTNPPMMKIVLCSTSPIPFVTAGHRKSVKGSITRHRCVTDEYAHRSFFASTLPVSAFFPYPPYTNSRPACSHMQKSYRNGASRDPFSVSPALHSSVPKS
ncbi:uncharacterized protein MONOS_11476 [Monocercomonoides exilis]|uniref:uncharacterized protein n=1 Tax=Monocercomonoides exilis TaxID=2049356 RepID=UPI00355A3D65|nr:hypothetical protein MONOS_11476 [Monocercomonoides exilis]|eukprot:MONOS_11476.1-p1 / transcript=MONOS_11476.1 / gene=MONOS_11476 / organism=Monocercomonoides_exilis_PA203 / gene_product=unspecified product / transcript_product=unspecified product / location=Mono_scaffold00578:38303-39112(-) / protein_length=270 / sequence_SO=supercontig / SO=protein_coding / is_pseudo=false